MLDRLRSLFAQHSQAPATPSVDPNRALKVAACALLLEMAHADDEFSADERQRIEGIVGRHFASGADATRELIEAADRERREATDLFQLTSVINREYDEGQRLLLSELLWRVVDADGSSQCNAGLASQRRSDGIFRFTLSFRGRAGWG